ncbi:hypothetical protein HMPREF9554_00104 [Treponema phagedenis F0421]|nr:hypothetical protein HMPREF9554_00104 [Treponema phagedenis F0421]QSH96070.1 hypothetical protein C5O78_13800 [Treponema phagedenis]
MFYRGRAPPLTLRVGVLRAPLSLRLFLRYFGAQKGSGGQVLKNLSAALRPPHARCFALRAWAALKPA